MNLLTEIRLRTYSDEMISEFTLLSQKIEQLAELTQSLRKENSELRLNSASLVNQNAILSQRMHEAHQRVTALLEKIPALEAEVETEVEDET
ncbi:MAG: DUF904 domain-containing protein [Pseudomonadota bacterium]